VAEGVETKEDVECLGELECDIGQGYYFYRPMPPNELEKLLNNL
jgi:EAL domain-containing protein (putative c-di-GMP-specific phosphodiesterase class I)